LNDSIFADAVNNHRTMVFRIAYGYVKDTHDADDVCQDVFLKLYNTSQTFAEDENMKAWLIRVTVNQAKSLLRSSWRTRRQELAEVAERASATLSQDEFELYEYVRDLKPKYRTVIYLYYYEGYSVREIAGILRISETSVTTQLGRARSQLKEILIEEGYSK
jgi:RNA polymerase sigma-70 factor (ECF subfamily)